MHAHSCLFEGLAILSVHDGVGGEIIHAGESHVDDLAEEVPHATARVGGVNAADDGDFFDDRKDFKFSDFHRDGIGIPIGHETGGRSGSGHAEATRVVDDDEISSAFFDELCGDSGACAGADDCFTSRQGVVKAFQHFFSSVGISDPGPWIWHSVVSVRGCSRWRLSYFNGFGTLIPATIACEISTSPENKPVRVTGE